MEEMFKAKMMKGKRDGSPGFERFNFNTIWKSGGRAGGGGGALLGRGTASFILVPEEVTRP